MLSSAALVTKVTLLKIPPQAWDAIIPHGPKISQHMVEFMAAGVVRDIAKLIKDKTLQTKVMNLGREMAAGTSKGLVAGWEEGDDICPPWFPFPPLPWPWPPKGNSGPHPDPWRMNIVEQVVLADLLMGLAGVTTSAAMSGQLKDAANALIKDSAHQLGDEFAKANVKPR